MKSEFQTLTLPNGIRCINRQVKSPVAYCALTINTGSRDELPTEHGIAHLAEHTIFKGTKKRKAHHINCRLENLGGELNAFTTKEETVIHTTTLKSDYSKATELIADLAFNSTFPEKEVLKEREVVVDEINSYKDSPTDLIFDEFEDLLFAGSELGHNILGTKKSVGKFTSTDLMKFTDRTYNTDQMVVSSIGNISNRNFVNAMHRYFGDIPTSQREFHRVDTGSYSPFEKSKSRNMHQAHCVIGNRAPNINDSQRVVLSLLINMLGGPSANSLLNVLLRERHGLTYGIEASYTPFVDTGIATIYFGTDKDKVGQCLELIEGQLQMLKTTAVSHRRLAMVKKQFLGQLTVSIDSNENYMLSAAKSFLLYNEVDGLDAIYRKVMSVSDREIMEMANMVFSNTSTLLYR